MRRKVGSWNWVGIKHGSKSAISHKMLILKAGIGSVESMSGSIKFKNLAFEGKGCRTDPKLLKESENAGSMLRIWIRDPVPFWPLDPGSGMGKKSRSGSESLEKNFGLKILKFFDADPDPGSGIFFTLDPGSGMDKFGTGVRDLGLTSRIRNTAHGNKYSCFSVLYCIFYGSMSA